MENKYNLRSPAVKRLMKEAAELRDPTEHYHAQPLEDNLFEWHFSVRGPPDSDFDGGVYHGRIILPPEYPMKPPSIILLTPNGRFEVGKKICLSISGHHPETWQPSWSIRTALIAIIGFMPTKGEGAIGSLDYTPEERRALAKKSQDFCCETCGCSMRTALLTPTSDSKPSQEDREAKELARQINFKAESSTASKASLSQPAVAAAAVVAAASETPASTQDEAASTFSNQEEPSEVQTGQAEADQPPGEQVTLMAPSNRPLSPRQRRAQQNQQPRRAAFHTFPAATRPPPEAGHTGSAVLIVVLTLALAALIFRRIYLASEYKFDYEL
ncbi:ubiquitin-conjugating enzyme E2 J1 [Scleropages formosus]|uniref:Ubiquitin-conjugating enzyme E2 J1 n=1 Tax=Scleropages formosus TaxID=113540 RepID=A0A8C9SJN9_SCLFO|nr:ubiquitin-conjugating enzyme E2 J1 [Scleropages formosus]